MRAFPPSVRLGAPEERATAQSLLDQLADLRDVASGRPARSSRPMGDEMFYRYQQSLIDEATTTLAALLERAPGAAPQAGV